MSRTADAVIEVDGRRLHTRTWGDGPVSVVMLHDGLGSITQWRDLPELVHRATGETILVYDRAGHGDSLPTPVGSWPADWMHTEAELLATLLAAVDLEQPLLVGHSDGASIALLHASAARDAVGGVVALAPHSYVEGRCVESIAAMRARPGQLIAALSDHHAAPAALFEAWSGVWVSDDFRGWDVRNSLGAITAPTLVLQGNHDHYASDEMLWSTVSAIGDGAQGRLLDGLGHLLHHEAPTLICELIAGF